MAFSILAAHLINNHSRAPKRFVQANDEAPARYFLCELDSTLVLDESYDIDEILAACGEVLSFKVEEAA